MIKKLALRLAILATVVFFLFSCVHDDFDRENNPQVSTFNVFQKSADGRDPDYAKGFAMLFKKYTKLHPEFSETQKRKKKENGAYIYLYMSSQMIILEDGSKTVFFPIIKKNKVTGIAAGILNKEEDYVSYHVLSEDTEGYHNILNTFDSRFKSKSSSLAAKADGSECGDDGTLCENIDPIIITPPPKKVKSIGISSDGTDNTHNPWNNNPGGGCGGFGDCNGGGGSSGPQTPQQNQDPCTKMKAQNLNAGYKEKIAELDKPSVLSQKKEKGFSETKSGVFTVLQQGTSTNTKDALKIPVTSDTKGYIHTHLNDYENGKYTDNNEPFINEPIRMFSPGDVNTLMTMAGFVTDGNYSELYGTMVSSYGNYTIKFTGTASDIKTGFDTEQWRLDYIDYRKENKYWSFEKLFLNFLKEKMNVQGVALYKIKSNGKIQKKTLNSSNNVQSEDCPQ
ncbi:hypothetical protein [Chryseobacterium herbae]|uniref:Lipoprotein n=1 Tax=Chryseobacterium herbae TaxID=2976476 RepID=A0ABT2IZI8_9FLAO|nr:hypothetical protein [Chryseobacterium sp. pc1-10]MCT2564273.1 hypothetical protein [Chryseobacterium sp. pc1-10]